MHASYTQLHLHLVWATWDRQPIILPEWKAAIGACIQSECLELKVAVIAQYAMPEHVHLLVRFPTTVDVATIAKRVKGSSSHLVTHQIAPGEWFKWQGGYGAFAVSKCELMRVQEYIQGQEQHHRHQGFDQEVEELESEIWRLKSRQQKHEVRLRGLRLRTCEGRFCELVAAISIARSFQSPGLARNLSPES